MRSTRAFRSVLIAGFALAITQVALAADASGSFSKTLTVSGTPDVTITTGAGRINVHSGNSSSVVIEGRIKANDNWGWFGNSSNLSAEERVKRLEANPPIVQ